MTDQAIGTVFDTQTWNGAAGEKPALAVPATEIVAMRTPSLASQDVARIVGVGILTATLLVGGIYLLWQAREVVGWFVGGCVIAAALNPAVNRMQKYHLKRSTAILVVFVMLALSVLGLMALMMPFVVDQIEGVRAFGRDLISHPGQGAQFLADLAGRFGFTPFLPRVQQWLQSLSGQLTVVAGGVLSYTTGLLNRLAALVTMLFIAYYLLLDEQRMTVTLFKHIPQEQQPRVRRILDESAGAISGYIMGDILISVICGVAVFVVLVVLGIPYAGALALLVAVLDLIPGIGATLGGIGLVVAGLFVSPLTGLIILIYFIIYQQVENYLLQPLIYSRRVHLHPLTITIAMLLGGAWMGLVGVLLAIPAAEIVRCIAVEWLASHAEKGESSGISTAIT